LRFILSPTAVGRGIISQRSITIYRIINEALINDLARETCQMRDNVQRKWRLVYRTAVSWEVCMTE